MGTLEDFREFLAAAKSDPSKKLAYSSPGPGTLSWLVGEQIARLGGVADRGELEQWANRLDELGIAHGGIKDAHYGSGVSFRDPDNIALEFFCPPA